MQISSKMSFAIIHPVNLIKAVVLIVITSCLAAIFAVTGLGADQGSESKEAWMTHPQFEQFKVRVIGVLPMDNMSLEPNIEKLLYKEVYKRLTAKGYSKIKVEKVNAVMQELGIQTPGQLAGISLRRLGRKLNCRAILRGRIDQSAAIHSVGYDAVVVSCSLRLQHCETGETLWQTEQWRTAHRQWQIDPLNMLLNFFAHEGASREKRLASLVHEMLKTLPKGPVQVEIGDLLNQAIEIQTKEE